jgi:Coenzyme PQQ synthesis protein D (PqqD)
MKKHLLNFVPAQHKDAIVRQLSEEFLVYDKETSQAHCLNRTATDVWKLCDGKITVAEIIQKLEKKSKSPVDQKIVWMALRQLQKSGLLLGRILSSKEKNILSRRALVKKMGVATALALPVVTSILVPTAAQAVSCLHSGQPCTSNSQCCSIMCHAINHICVGG